MVSDETSPSLFEESSARLYLFILLNPNCQISLLLASLAQFIVSVFFQA